MILTLFYYMQASTFQFFCFRKKLFNLRQSELSKRVNTFFYIYWHKWFSIYLIKYMHEFYVGVSKKTEKPRKQKKNQKNQTVKKNRLNRLKF